MRMSTRVILCEVKWVLLFVSLELTFCHNLAQKYVTKEGHHSQFLNNDKCFTDELNNTIECVHQLITMHAMQCVSLNEW